MGIYVWGTGCGASELIGQGLDLGQIDLFVDSFPCGETFLDKPVLLPENADFDNCGLLIVTTRHTDAVANRCAQLGVPEEKILYIKNNCRLEDRNAHCTAAAKLLGEDLLHKLTPRQQMVPVPPQLRSTVLSEADVENDYARLATLELLCRRLADVPGSAAELGVYKGFFARCINRLLPNRKLHLFDSFSGFLPEAGATQAFQAAHANTSAQRVLSVMPFPEQIVLHPGFFPESLNGLEERFCLVSLDVDFRQTTLDGLRYFWPRLENGGYLLLHDWGEPKLPGVAAALRQYEQEIGQRIVSLPLCDAGGTLILCK